ncbi:EamA family transporter [Lichenifustis flavocetrariae]|uniref:EamA family transporter n=1 Tax=Lichenifustis flavocetrariae TaxID=2949735 RepID=A0AA42CMI2_9HYPH|nr:EamA family transporter [Lichenifustis flavocetrariae]MCW6512709.1 EamA family transporter [Lichenifustis flavocetrariae]
MSARHAALGVLVAALWGFNFVAARLALAHISPLLLVALRFGIASLPAMFLPRPRVSWSRMVALASTLFIGQFSFLFWGMHVGMPPGLASVLTQFQAVLTMVLAGAFLREMPAPRQIVGLLIATAGLILVAATVGRAGVTLTGLLLTLLAAASWAVGNVLLRAVGRTDMLSLIVWLSVIPPLPMLLLSLAVDGPPAIVSVMSSGMWISLLAVLYIAVAATLGGYALWGHLLRLYPAGSVAPFALLVPVFGLLSARITLGEQFSPMRLTGIAVLALGLVIASLPLAGWASSLLGVARRRDSKNAELHP